MGYFCGLEIVCVFANEFLNVGIVVMEGGDENVVGFFVEAVADVEEDFDQGFFPEVDCAEEIAVLFCSRKFEGWCDD